MYVCVTTPSLPLVIPALRELSRQYGRERDYDGLPQEARAGGPEQGRK